MAETRLRRPDETYEQIKQIAGSDAQSVNSAMVVAIEEYIATAVPRPQTSVFGEDTYPGL